MTIHKTQVVEGHVDRVEMAMTSDLELGAAGTTQRRLKSLIEQWLELCCPGKTAMVSSQEAYETFLVFWLVLIFHLCSVASG